MIDAKNGSETTVSAEKKPEGDSIEELLRILVGRIVTISNPESMKKEPLGYQLKPEIYKAKVLDIRGDMVVILAERGKGERAAPMKQCIPVRRVKLVCLAKDDVHIHI